MKEVVMYSIDNRQRKKLQEVRREAKLHQEELTDKIVELEEQLKSLKKEYYEWLRIECATRNMENGVIQFKADTLKPM